MSNDLDSLRTLVARATGTGWEAAYRQDVTALVAEVERLRAENRHMREAYTWARAEADRLGQELAAMRTRMQELEAGEARRMFLDAVCFSEPHERAQLAVYARELLKDEEGL